MAKIDDIQLLRINYLRGPNIWTYRPALEVWLDLGVLEDHPSNTIAGLNDRLTTWLPALQEHHCGVGERGGFLQRLQEGTWCGHVLEHVVNELLNLGHAHGLRPDPQHVGAWRVPHGFPGAGRAGGPRCAGARAPPADGRHQR
jgi:hypothetical protein